MTIDQLERKTLAVELKADEEGKFAARFATLGVVDKQGDVVLPSAIQNGKAVIVSPFEHASIGIDPNVPVLPPVGKAVISTKGDVAIGEGSFFLKTGAGRETYERVKAMGDQQQWSFGYGVLDYSTKALDLKAYPGARRILKALQIEEISPVVIGAGVNTATEYIKSDGSSKGDEAIRTLKAHTEETLENVLALVGRVNLIEAKVGRTISTANRDRLKAIWDQMTQAAGDLGDFLTTHSEVVQALEDDATGNDPADSPIPEKPKSTHGDLLLEFQRSLADLPTPF